ncbi:outer membrane protein assembly factor BamE [Halieaceae bacterium IMCC14734]|uniref:Outer membrane protein assembly factor BamE n=2 Tax=Candidatus Litorirhabdus singularis TaxID=2518993 RepID=A0ABT3TLZ9_9GAMM|nr:outer membrane protein assembly factor BamE [Candidatus Litorirhabdus singularis]
MAITACSNIGFPGVYRINVEQGNIITQEMIDQLKPGMNQRQVRFILGTPLTEDSFNQARWDYLFLIRNGNDTIEEERLTVFFDGDKLSYFTGTYLPSSEAALRQAAAAERAAEEED